MALGSEQPKTKIQDGAREICHSQGNVLCPVPLVFMGGKVAEFFEVDIW